MRYFHFHFKKPLYIGILLAYFSLFSNLANAQYCDILLTQANTCQPTNNGTGVSQPRDGFYASQVPGTLIDFNWNNNGYIRYDLSYPGCFLLGQIIYVAESDFYVEISPSNIINCNYCTKSLSKNYQAKVSYSMLCDQSAVNGTGANDGEISIAIESLTGVPPFTVNINTVGGFSQTISNFVTSATFTNLPGLTWYNVELRDSDGTLTENDVWVPICLTGRN